MKFNERGMPRPNGSTDFEDSPVCAALILLFNCEGFESIKAVDYLNAAGNYQRCPDSKYTISRDQYIALVVLFGIQKLPWFIGEEFIDGKDIIPPSVKGHRNRCKGVQSTILQNAWLWMDVWFHATYTPRGESNQLILMMWFAHDDYLIWWCENNSLWQESITDYWYTWRGERDLADAMIARIQLRIQKKNPTSLQGLSSIFGFPAGCNSKIG